jgi:Fur family ferric uptake transcriptional regulator
MSVRPNGYNTKQSEAVLALLRSNRSRHMTAAQIADSLPDVGRTTVYRRLERLVGRGLAKKYVFDGVSGACFQYAEPHDGCEREHFSLKCETCGGVTSVHCGALEKVTRHLLRSHGFRIDDAKTVFYGVCKACEEAKL